MKKNILSTLILSIISTLLFSCGELKIDLELIALEDVIDFHSDIQKEYLLNEDPSECSSRGTSEESLPQAVKISWNSKISSGSVNKYLIHVSEDEDFSSSFIYSTNSRAREYNLYNLKLNTRYYYKIEAVSSTSSFISQTSSFLTINYGLRNLYIDGVTNVRDLGGENIKQGLIYRSATFDNNTCFYPTQDISEDGINTCLNDLNIKTEIDLRANYETSLTSSKLGDSVSYYHIPMTTGQGANMLTFKGQIRNKDEQFDNPKAIKDIFDVLKDDKNYPLDFHCVRGTDRTGLLSFLVKGLCGDILENIQKDYMFSNFAVINGTVKVSNMMGSDTLDNQYGYMLLHYSNGDTLKEKIYNYLKDVILIDEGTLNAVITILTK